MTPTVRSFGHVGGGEPNPAVAQGLEEGRVSAEPVQFGDQQKRASALGQMQRPGQFRPLCIAPALNLAEPYEDLSPARGSEVLDHLALYFKPKSTSPLPRAVGTRS